METYKVTTVPQTERDKADTIPDYSPAEVVIATITAECEAKALKRLSAGIQLGMFPRDAMIVLS